jgi:hypothetical protein
MNSKQYPGNADRLPDQPAVKWPGYELVSPVIPAAVETFGCHLGAPFQDLLRMCARRATTSRVRDESSIGAEASRLLYFYRQRMSVILQRSQAQSIHHQSARVIHSTSWELDL